jgi:putative transposase
LGNPLRVVLGPGQQAANLLDAVHGTSNILADKGYNTDTVKVERFFNRLKQFRRLATRYDKTANSFLGMVHFVSALLWLR